MPWPAVAAAVACSAMGAVFGQAPSLPASNWLVSPECGPARPGCKLSPAARRQVERQMRFEALRQQSVIPSGISGSGPSQTVLPLPTPADQIRPEHLERSTVRPEFHVSGERIGKSD